MSPYWGAGEKLEKNQFNYLFREFGFDIEPFISADMYGKDLSVDESLLAERPVRVVFILEYADGARVIITPRVDCSNLSRACLH